MSGMWNLKNEKWQKWVRYLSEVETANLPRWHSYVNKNWDVEEQLRVFVDASENGFAAIAYIRTANRGSVESSLIEAKNPSGTSQVVIYTPPRVTGSTS